MADSTGGKLPMPQVQGPTQALESQPLVLTFRYTYPYGHKSGDLSFQWQSWYCEPGKGGAPSNITIDESPWPGTGCTSPVVRGGLLSTGNSVATIRFDVTQPGAWYVRARLLSRQSGNGPWGNWHRTDVHLQQPGALLARPVIDWPYYGTEIIGKGVSLALNPGTGREDDDNWEYQLDWQRARVTTEFNNAYVRSHTAPGQVMESAMSSMREPWNDPKRPTTVSGFPVTMLADLTFDIVRPHSHKFGYRYWVRAREHDLPTDTYSPWSGWDSFTIQEAPGTPLSPVSPGKPDYTIKGLKPPIVQAPKQNRIFVNQGVVIEVSPTLKHTDYSRWEYAFEWKREDYNTVANNAYAKRTYLKKYPNSSSSYFPPTLGRNSSLQPWLSPARLRTMPENSGTTGGFQVVGSKAPTMSVHLNFSTLRSKRKDASYLYQFRVREYSRDSNAYGPWSPWRGFIVQERIGPSPLRQIGHKGMVFSGLSHMSLPKSSGHKGMGLSRPSRPPSLAKPKLTIQYAIASSTKACDPNRLLKMNVVIRNGGGPLLAHTRFAYVRAVESGGAHLASPHVSLPAIPAQKTWRGVLAIGTRKSFFPKLPGRHTLLVSIGPDHAAVGTLAYIPPLPFRATVNFPAGYCQQLRYRNIGALMRGATRGAIHGTTRGKPAVGLRHGMQQRGVQKKLTPVTPALRFAPRAPVRRLIPAAPVRRLNLPAQLKLNR
jgi:hypothetical protein